MPRLGRELSTLPGLVVLGVGEWEGEGGLVVLGVGEREGEGGWLLEEVEGVAGSSCICEIRDRGNG